MEIEELMFKKNSLEIDLIRTISKKLIDFEEETGYSPSSVDIELKDVTNMLDKEPKYIVTDVKCRFNFIEYDTVNQHINGIRKCSCVDGMIAIYGGKPYPCPNCSQKLKSEQK